MRRSFHECSSEVAVIGQQEQTFAGVIETSDWINALTNSPQESNDSGASLRILHSCDVAFRFVQRQIGVALRPAQQLSVYANVIMLRVCFRPECGNRLPIHGHRAASDQLFGMTAGSDTGSSDDFLQAFACHKRLVN